MFDFRFISWESHTNFGVVRGARVSVCSSVKSRIPSREKPLCGQKIEGSFERHVWRGARVVDRGGLENRCAHFEYRGFESLPLRWIKKKDKRKKTKNVLQLNSLSFFFFLNSFVLVFSCLSARIINSFL